MPVSREEARSLKQLGASIRRRRMQKELTQQRLAELSNLDIRNVQRIEAGEINLLFSTFNRIRKALECSWEELAPND